MDYRNAFYAAGITQGFQWIDGSFVENVERRHRPGKEPRPYDIDVVTFYSPPEEEPPELRDLLRSAVTRDRYDIDAHSITLGALVDAIAYWCGMWSTRRTDQMSKGLVRVDLNPQHDLEARRR